MAHDVTAVTDPGQLITFIPHLFGYYPIDSIVVLALDDDRIDFGLRTDCPAEPGLYPLAAVTLADQIGMREGARAVAVVVATPTDDHVLARQLRTKFTEAGVPLRLFGVPAIIHGARWFDYDDAEHHGHLPDPTTSVFAVRAVAKGLVTLPSREALEAQLAPDPENVLARRAALLHTLHHDQPQETEPTPGDQVDWIRHHYLDRIAGGDETFTDTDIVQVGHALSRLDVRDECLSLLFGPHAAAAEKLWVILTRQCPPPACAEAATLLAFSAYLRGDGTLAAIAIARALTVHPEHRLACLLRDALDRGLRPAQLHDLITSSTDDIV